MIQVPPAVAAPNENGVASGGKGGTYFEDFEVIYAVTLLVYEETKHTVPPKNMCI